MKVLKNNFNEIAAHTTEVKIEPYPRILTCESCESELEYEKSDMEVGVLGAMHVKCPLCGYNNMLDGNENDVILTKDNIEFPLHFFSHSKEGGAVDICDNKHIKEYVNNAINYFRKNKNEFAYFIASGNLYIAVYKLDGDNEYDVIVAKDYYNTYIPFETEDY